MRAAVLLSLLLTSAVAQEPDVQAPPPADKERELTVLTLEEAQRRALEGNPSLRAAEDRVRQAEMRVRQARALYFPSLDAEYRATHTDFGDNPVGTARDAALWGPISGAVSSLLQSILTGGAGLTVESAAGRLGSAAYQGVRARDSIDDSGENYSATLTASYLIFDGFSRRFTLAAARHGAGEVEAARLEAQRLLLAAVARAYYSAQLARANIEISSADEAFNQRLLKDAEARRRVGTGALSDVLNFEVRLRAARTAVLEHQRTLAQSRIGLSALMGIEGSALPETVSLAELEPESPAEMQLPDPESLVSFALDNRPDLHQTKSSAARLRSILGARKSAYYPRISTFASRDASLTDNSRFEDQDFASTVGLQVTYNLFSGGRNRAAVAEARYAAAEAERLLEQAAIDAAAEVRQSLEDLHTAQQQLILQRATTEYVEKNRDLVEREFKAGQAPLTRLNEAQRDLIEAQGRLALARVGLRYTWHELRTATAETLTALAQGE